MDNYRRKAILKGVSSDYIFSFIMIVANIAIIPIYLLFITISEYGLWLVITSLLALVTIFEFGGDTYLVKQLSNSKIFNTTTSVAYIYISFALKGILTILYVVYMFLIVFVFNEKLLIEHQINNLGIYTFIVGVVYLIILQILSTLSSILISQNMLFKINSMNFLINIFNLAITIVLMIFGLNIMSFAIAQLTTCIVATIWLSKEVYDIHISLKPTNETIKEIKHKGPALIKESFKYLKSFYFIRMLHLFRNNFMNIFLSGAVSNSIVAIFNITNKIPSLIPGYISKITNALFPTYSENFADNNIKNLKKSFINIFSLIVRASLFVIICLIFLNAHFVKIWVGASSFAGPAISLALIFYLIPACISAIVGSIIYASGKFGKYNLFAVIEIILTIVLTFFGFKLYAFAGAVIGFVIPINLTVIFLIMHSSMLLEINIADLMTNIFKKNITPFASSLLSAFIMSIFFMNNPEWLSLFIFVIVVFVCNIFFKEGIAIIKLKDFSKESIKIAFSKDFK